jgi:hypothetical protein
MINATTVGRKVEITPLLEQNGAVNGILLCTKLARILSLPIVECPERNASKP